MLTAQNIVRKVVKMVRPRRMMQRTYKAIDFLTGIERYGYASVTNDDIGLILSTFPVIGGGEGYILISVEERTIRVRQEQDHWMCHQEDAHWRVYDVHGVPLPQTFPTAAVAREWVNAHERDRTTKERYGGFFCTRAPHCEECEPEVRYLERCEILTVYCTRLGEPCKHCWEAKEWEAAQRTATKGRRVGRKTK